MKATWILLQIFARNSAFGVGAGGILGASYAGIFALIALFPVSPSESNILLIILADLFLMLIAAVLGMSIGVIIGGFVGGVTGLVTGTLTLLLFFPLSNGKWYSTI